jgi:hypothetical protein
VRIAHARERPRLLEPRGRRRARTQQLERDLALEARDPRRGTRPPSAGADALEQEQRAPALGHGVVAPALERAMGKVGDARHSRAAAAPGAGGSSGASRSARSQSIGPSSAIEVAQGVEFVRHRGPSLRPGVRSARVTAMRAASLLGLPVISAISAWS